MDKRGNREKARAILIVWKWKEGSNATVGKLADVLEKEGRKDIAEKLLGELKKSYISFSLVGWGLSRISGSVLNIHFTKP